MKIILSTIILVTLLTYAISSPILSTMPYSATPKGFGHNIKKSAKRPFRSLPSHDLLRSKKTWRAPKQLSQNADPSRSTHSRHRRGSVLTTRVQGRHKGVSRMSRNKWNSKNILATLRKHSGSSKMRGGEGGNGGNATNGGDGGLGGHGGSGGPTGRGGNGGNGGHADGGGLGGHGGHGGTGFIGGNGGHGGQGIRGGLGGNGGSGVFGGNGGRGGLGVHGGLGGDGGNGGNGKHGGRGGVGGKGGKGTGGMGTDGQDGRDGRDSQRRKLTANRRH